MKYNTGYLYIFLTVILSVYGQVILKWRMNKISSLPVDLIEKALFLVRSIFDPYILSSFAAAFVASLTWMVALTKFELSFAYPFTSASFVLVLICSFWFLGEVIDIYKVSGIFLIILGLLVASRSF